MKTVECIIPKSESRGWTRMCLEVPDTITDRRVDAYNIQQQIIHQRNRWDQPWTHEEVQEMAEYVLSLVERDWASEFDAVNS